MDTPERLYLFSTIIKKVRYFYTDFSKLQYFDADDFYYKTFKVDKKDYFMLLCVAKKGTKCGRSGKGPKIGWVHYNSKTGKWTEDYESEDYQNK